MKEPISLQSTLLIAALHYSWRIGTLQDFDMTFLHHKAELFRTINASITKEAGNLSTVALKLIAILSLTEASKILNGLFLDMAS